MRGLENRGVSLEPGIEHQYIERINSAQLQAELEELENQGWRIITLTSTAGERINSDSFIKKSPQGICKPNEGTTSVEATTTEKRSFRERAAARLKSAVLKTITGRNPRAVLRALTTLYSHEDVARYLPTIIFAYPPDQSTYVWYTPELSRDPGLFTQLTSNDIKHIMDTTEKVFRSTGIVLDWLGHGHNKDPLKAPLPDLLTNVGFDPKNHRLLNFDPIAAISGPFKLRAIPAAIRLYMEIRKLKKIAKRLGTQNNVLNLSES